MKSIKREKLRIILMTGALSVKFSAPFDKRFIYGKYQRRLSANSPRALREQAGELPNFEKSVSAYRYLGYVIVTRKTQDSVYSWLCRTLT